MKKLSLFVPLLGMVGTACWQSAGVASPSATARQEFISAPTAPVPPGLTTTPTQGTVTLAVTPSGQPIHPTGTIFIWNEFPAGLVAVEPEPDSRVIFLESESAQGMGPDQAVAAAFSSYSGQLSYLTTIAGRELWVADLDLRHVERVWVDNSNWLDDALTGGSVELQWGPNDQYVILTSSGSDPGSVVYSLKSKTTEQLVGACNQIGVSPGSGHLALWCGPSGEEPKHTVLEWDGTIRKTVVAPHGPAPTAIAWAFSPKGDRVLYASDQRKLGILESDGRSVDLLIAYARDSWEVKRSLRWSRDGTRVLAYGYDQSAGRCPAFLNPETDLLQERPCWQVLDAATGSRLWWPSDNLVSALASSWDRLGGTDSEAALSPDGGWVAMSLRASGVRYFIATSITENRTVVIGNFSALHLTWED